MRRREGQRSRTTGACNSCNHCAFVPSSKATRIDRRIPRKNSRRPSFPWAGLHERSPAPLGRSVPAAASWRTSSVAYFVVRFMRDAPC